MQRLNINNFPGPSPGPGPQTQSGPSALGPSSTPIHSQYQDPREFYQQSRCQMQEQLYSHQYYYDNNNHNDNFGPGPGQGSGSAESNEHRVLQQQNQVQNQQNQASNYQNGHNDDDLNRQVQSNNHTQTTTQNCQEREQTNNQNHNVNENYNQNFNNLNVDDEYDDDDVTQEYLKYASGQRRLFDGVPIEPRPSKSVPSPIQSKDNNNSNIQYSQILMENLNSDSTMNNSNQKIYQNAGTSKKQNDNYKNLGSNSHTQGHDKENKRGGPNQQNLMHIPGSGTSTTKRQQQQQQQYGVQAILRDPKFIENRLGNRTGQSQGAAMPQFRPPLRVGTSNMNNVLQPRQQHHNQSISNNQNNHNCHQGLPVNSLSRKTDIVSLGQRYRQEWGQQKFLKKSATRKFDINTRDKIGQNQIQNHGYHQTNSYTSEHSSPSHVNQAAQAAAAAPLSITYHRPPPKTTVTANANRPSRMLRPTYVPPHEKRRDNLRMNVRAKLLN